MNTEIFDQIQSLMKDRYGSPKGDYGGHHDGPYSRGYAFDLLLKRDVELCTEWAHNAYESDGTEISKGRKYFLRQVRNHSLVHPNLVPILEFRIGDDKLFYFTKPIFAGVGLQHFIERFIPQTDDCSFYEAISVSRIHPVLAEEYANRNKYWMARQHSIREAGFADWVDLPVESPNSGVSIPSELLDKWNSKLDGDLAECRRRIPSRIDDDFKAEIFQHRSKVLVTDACDELSREIGRLNRAADSTYSNPRRAVRLNAFRFADVVLKASQGIAYAHRHGIWHLCLTPDSVEIDTNAMEAVHIPEWEHAHVVGVDSDSEIGRSRGKMPRADDTWRCEAPELQPNGDRSKVGPHTDVFALGGILAYLLQAVKKRSYQRDPPTQFRDADLSPDESSSSGLRATKLLAEIASKAQREDPSERFQSVDELAAAITNCLCQLQSDDQCPHLDR